MNVPGEKSALLVQADYHAECGIWGSDGCICYPVERLGISPELDAKMRRWIEGYYAMLDDAPFPYEEFSREGRELAQELKRQLGDDYEVQYYDEAKNRDQETGESIWDTIE